MGKGWLKALDRRPKDQPFFLWLAHHDPHRGYRPDQTIDDPYEPAEAVVPPYLPDTQAVREDLAAYYNEVTRFDKHVGMVLDRLDQRGLAKNTFVLLISDNGRPFPHCKTRLNTPGIKTPFLVRWPAGVENDRKTDSVVSVVDIAPTILELAGLDALESFQGRSFVPILKDPEAETRQYAFAEHNWHDYRAYERAVHGEDYVYVRNWLTNVPATPPADAVNSPTFSAMRRLNRKNRLNVLQDDAFRVPRTEHHLYHYDSDPFSLFNLAGSPAYQAKLADMQKALSNWRKRTKDVFPDKGQLTPSAFDRFTGQRTINAMHPSFREP
jgi:arylsulfatase A-like enzyme